jgi:signal transduction histidine kinase
VNPEPSSTPEVPGELGWGDVGFAQARQREASRLDALVTLAAAMANDFNNALAVVAGSVALARMHMRVDPAAAERKLDTAREATQRAARLVQRVLTWARPAAGALVAVDPESLLLKIAEIVGWEADSRITVTIRFDHGGWQMWGDRSQLADVVLALVENAREAMPEGGSLTLGAARAAIRGARTPGGPAERREFVRIEVTDTGRGIPESVLPRVFEPFFTTKPLGQGVGLGLAMVYGTLRQLEGGVTVESREGHGTTFHVYVPRAIPPRD